MKGKWNNEHKSAREPGSGLEIGLEPSLGSGPGIVSASSLKFKGHGLKNK